MLTAKQKRLLDYIDGYTKQNAGVSPTFEEMRSAVGSKSKSRISAMLGCLEERGFVERHRSRARAITVLRTSTPNLPPAPLPVSTVKRAVMLLPPTTKWFVWDEGIKGLMPFTLTPK